MSDIQSLGKILVVVGGVMLVMGAVVLMLGGKFPWLGRLPGDIYLQRKNFTFVFPITTCILVSLIISAIVYLLGRR